VIYLKGHGVRRLGKEEPVTPDTVFGIGSLTKAMTATGIGILVDDGKMAWDEPVRKHLPWFRLSDPLADRDVTLRDLLCHRTGLARHDHLWYRAPWTVEESVRRMARLEPSSSFRSRYEYCNLTYLAAGLALSGAAEEPWTDFLRKRLFEPLDMKAVVYTATAARKSGRAATPHTRKPSGDVEPIDWYPDDEQLRASGSVKTNVRDLGRWVRFQLNGGVLDGKRVISAKTLAETHTPQVVQPPEPERYPPDDVNQISYGLGWRVFDYRGKLVWEHAGAVDGFRARVVLLPRERLGLVVLVNVDDMGAVLATSYALIDKLLGLPPRDWNAYFLKYRVAHEQAAAARAEALARTRRPGTKPSHPAADYAGAYEDPAYGTLRVTADGERLRLSWGGYDGPLTHYHFDTFTLEGPGESGREQALFDLRPDGSVGAVRFLGRMFRRRE
jgi:CubicO group peptidase (beta-lactamase class C family)